MSDNKFYYHMIHAEVICTINGEVNILNSQFFTKSDTDMFRADRLRHLQNTAVHKIFSKQSPANQKTFTAIDVVIKNILFLGLMADDDFWAGMGEEEQAPIAVPENAQSDNIVVPIKPVQEAGTDEA